MSDKSIGKVLQDFFPESSKIDWKKVAVSEINGKDPFDFLSWTGKDQILFLPYYNREDVGKLDYLQSFQLSPANNSFSQTRFWVNLPSIKVKQTEAANATALNHLANGAEGILFDLRNSHQVNMDQLFDQIQWKYCFVAFHLNDASDLHHLISVIGNYEAASLTGALFWESFPKTTSLENILDKCRQLKCLGLIIQPAEPTVEISHALLKGVEMFEAMAAAENHENIFRSICFSLSTDISFFETVAKFKALRILWYQVARAYGLNDYNVTDLHIHARVNTPEKNTAFSPENLITCTLSEMSAVMGGCDSITIDLPDDQLVMSRLTRNVSNILKEESFFNKVADPVAGAYALDVITDEMARKAWEVFQLKSRSI